MSKKKFRVDILSPSSIEQLKKDLMDYQNDLQKKVSLLCKRLADEGVETAQAMVVSLDAVFTGELFNSIHSQKVSESGASAIFSVVADSSHALFLEIGTGLIGAESPYPGELPVTYAQGKTIRQLSDGRYGWFYQRDGNWYFTEGMPSRPFMYFTAQELRERVVEIAKEVFA